MKRIIPILSAAIIFLLVFSGVSHAASAVEPQDGSLWDVVRPVYDAFASGHYLWAGASCLVVGVALFRRYAISKTGFWASDAGSALLVLLGSFGATLVATLAGNVTPTWQHVSSALKIAFMAAGGFSAAKKLIIEPYLAKWVDRGPKWIHVPMQLVLWIFARIEATAAEQAVAGVKAINSPSSDVQVIVNTPTGSAVASSPATTIAAPAPITVVSADAAGNTTPTPNAK